MEVTLSRVCPIDKTVNGTVQFDGVIWWTRLRVMIGPDVHTDSLHQIFLRLISLHTESADWARIVAVPCAPRKFNQLLSVPIAAAAP